MTATSPDFGALEPDIRRLLHAEAYRVPMRLTGAEVAARVAATAGAGGQWGAWLRLAAAGTVAALVVVMAMSSITTGPRPRGSASPGASACDASPATIHGTWWSEIGGPNAFFNIEPGTRRATTPRETWLLHVRYEPDAPEGGAVQVSAENLATGVVVPGTLNSRADPANIFRFDQPAPALPGGWYLFEQVVPGSGCWKLRAAIDGVEVGTAVVLVGEPAADPMTKEDCYGEVPYSLVGWQGPVFVMETADEVLLYWTPPDTHGQSRPATGRGRCEIGDGTTISRDSIGPVHFGPAQKPPTD